jgi:hypothetical protein
MTVLGLSLQAERKAKVPLCGPMVKPDPYGDWVLFPPEEGETERSGSIDYELIAAAREALAARPSACT